MNIKSFPSRIVLELTPLCNLSCAMCPRHYIKNTDGYMDGVLFKKLVDEIAVEDPEAVVLPFWRGESCVHPAFAPMLNYALDKGVRIHLSTNGHYVDKEFVGIFCRCEFMTFSIHTERGYKNARHIVEQKPTGCQTTFQISFVESEKNTKKYLEECISDENMKGFDSVRLYEEHTIGGKFGKSADEAAVKRTYCPKLNHTFVVDAEGHFSRCNHIWETETAFNLANVTIREAWESTRMGEIRIRYPDEKCASCDQWSGHTNGQCWRKDSHGRIEHVFYRANQDVRHRT